MRSVVFGGLAALMIALAMASAVQAQPPGPPARTTRILAIGTFPAGTNLDVVRAILPAEIRETVKLYLDGRIDQWFSRADRNGVVFLLNETDPKQAAAMLEQLPLGRTHLMRFELIPLAPLAPLRRLPGMADGSP